MPRVFIHGLGQTPESWEKTTALLPGENICPGLPELIRGREISYSSLYAAFTALCDSAAGPLSLCGLSLGGVLALNYAVDRPERVRSLALIGTQYKMPRGLLRLQNLVFRLMPGSAFDRLGFGKEGFIGLCRDMMKLDFTASLGRVACPVLVACGENDSANLAASKKLAKGLPNAALRVIGGAGHEVNTEAPEALAAALESFEWAEE